MVSNHWVVKALPYVRMSFCVIGYAEQICVHFMSISLWVATNTPVGHLYHLAEVVHVVFRDYFCSKYYKKNTLGKSLNSQCRDDSTYCSEKFNYYTVKH